MIYWSIAWRLAKAGGTFKALAQLLTGLIGACLILTGASIHAAVFPEAEYTSYHYIQLGVAWVSLLIPLAVLLSVVGRLSSAARDQRLAALRLLGLSPRQTALVAALEHAPTVFAGALVGVGVYAAARPLANQTLAGPGKLVPGQFILVWPYLPLAVISLSLASAVLAAGSLWSLSRRSMAVRASAHSRRRPGWWRLVPFAIGLGLVVVWPMTEAAESFNRVMFLTIIIGALVTFTGLVLVVPLLVDRLARLYVRSGRTGSVLAGRQILAEPAGG
ncbi:MAG: hypothetical protein FWG16_07470, partial [Micrococcales bacterium]|nr:hypothetical protein [Micrococcales bacterium]